MIFPVWQQIYFPNFFKKIIKMKYKFPEGTLSESRKRWPRRILDTADSLCPRQIIHTVLSEDIRHVFLPKKTKGIHMTGEKPIIIKKA